jgi:hypothetical protein
MYAEEELLKALRLQQKHAWNIETDINWSSGIDLSRFLLPLDKKNILFPSANDDQKLAISQFLGLLVAGAIGELEKVLIKCKVPCWENILKQYPVNPELFALGEEFMAEEEKHAAAFDRYIDMFAGAVNIEPKDLRQLLPTVNEKLISPIFKWDGLLGGMALWWVVAAVEEESIEIYKQIKPYKKSIDPLYFEVHKKHFEEEVRHSSYAFIMLDLMEKRAGSPVEKILKKVDFLVSEVMQITWTFQQLWKLNKLKKLKDHHPFFKNLSEVMVLLKDLTPFEIIHTLFTDAPYISLILNPAAHAQVQLALKQSGGLKIPRPRIKENERVSY